MTNDSFARFVAETGHVTFAEIPPKPADYPGAKKEMLPRKVIKGGSHLCAPNYCRRYPPAACFPEPIDTSTCHLGFRCIVRSDRDAASQR